MANSDICEFKINIEKRAKFSKNLYKKPQQQQQQQAKTQSFQVVIDNAEQ
jgi:hypothetical protein